MLAGGQDADALTARLRELQALAARAADPGEPAGGPPLVGEAGFELHAFPVADLAVAVPQYIAPSDWRNMDEEIPFAHAASEGVVRFGSSEQIVELLRNSAPLRWDHPDAALLAVNSRLLLATQSPATAADLQTFIDRHLRVRAHRTVSLEVEWIELPQALALELAAHPMELPPNALARLEEARKAGVAEARFAGRMLLLSGQISVMWHGVQAAHVADSDVEVAQESQTADPIVGVEQFGTTIAARVHLTEPGQRNHVAVRFVSDMDAEGGDAGDWLLRPTHDTGILQLASRRYTNGRARMELRSGAWGIGAAGRVGGPRASGARWRLLLVRAVELAPGGGTR